jgi:rod shape-determining protein MreD
MFATVLALFIARMSLGDLIRIAGAVPDFVFIAVMFFGIFFGKSAGFEAGIAGGILTDIFSLDIPGMNTFILAVTGYVAGSLGNKLSRDSRVGQFCGVLIFFVMSSSLRYYLVSRLSSPVVFSFSEFLAAAVSGQAAYTAALAVPLFSMGIKLYGLRETEELI